MTVGGVDYVLRPEPLRTSLTDGPTMLWGFQVFVDRDGQEVGMKTCFVGRVSVQFRNADALTGAMDGLIEVVHELAFEKIRERLEAGEPGDEILFA